MKRLASANSQAQLQSSHPQALGSTFNPSETKAMPYQIDKEELIQNHKQEIIQLRQNEVQEMKQYLREEDPETCINILFVLSQCKSQEANSEGRRHAQGP